MRKTLTCQTEELQQKKTELSSHQEQIGNLTDLVKEKQASEEATAKRLSQLNEDTEKAKAVAADEMKIKFDRQVEELELIKLELEKTRAELEAAKANHVCQLEIAEENSKKHLKEIEYLKVKIMLKCIKQPEFIS